MGLGPSIKMTTKHHYNCPITKVLSADKDLEFLGIIVDGVSEICDDKIYTATRAGFLAEGMRADGAIVAIDGWGNHHIDFVNLIEQLGIKGIPSIGLSYIGLQGRMVCTNSYVDTVIDFNKCESGYESCVVGENNLTEFDAIKAVALLKNKMQKKGNIAKCLPGSDKDILLRKLTRKTVPVTEVRFGSLTSLKEGILTIRKGIEKEIVATQARIKEIHVNIISPDAHDFFVNSNLDYAPIACKVQGGIGEGITHLLEGVTVMLTGVEDRSGFQPSNIGSSEGIFSQQVVFDQEGTPKSTDCILHIDFLFEEGEGRTAEGIQAAHAAADMIVQEIRGAMQNVEEMKYRVEEFFDVKKNGKEKVVLIKVISGLGNMYDSSLFPNEPAGYLGSRQMMDIKNMPIYLTPNQCRDGAIHSLL